MLNKTYTAIALLVLTLSVIAPPSLADDVIIGKVVNVADGDTITVLEDRTQHRIRLYGIDAPERRQDFSNRAKQFASDLVFGKKVRVVKKDIDRYDRIVGIVYVGDVCVNEELVRNGLAWVYRYYCKIPVRYVRIGWNWKPKPRLASWGCGHILMRCHHGSIGGADKKEPSLFPDLLNRSTTWRTSATHRRPLGFLVEHWQPPPLNNPHGDR